MNLDLNFNSLNAWALGKLPFVEKGLERLYSNNKRLQRFFKYGTWLMLEYWILKGPLIWIATAVLGIWYILSGFIVGIFLALMGFVLNEFWIWRERRHAKV